MNERFDDMIRRRLQGHESEVPDGLFDAMSQRDDVQDAFLDNTIRGKLANTKTTVPAGMFDAVHAAASLEHLEFDSTLLNKLEGYTSPVPADMWLRIMAEKDRRRRPVAWWWMAATVLLLAGGGTTFLLNHKTRSSSVVTEKREPGKPGNQLVKAQETKRATGKDAIYSKPTGPTAPMAIPDQVASSTSTQDIIDHNEFVPASTQLLSGKQTAGNNGSPLKKSQLKVTNDTQETSAEQTDVLQAGSTLQAINENNLATAQLSILELLRNATRLSPGQLLKAKLQNPVIPCPVSNDEKRAGWYVDLYGSAFLLQKDIHDKGMGKNAKAGFDTTLHRQVSVNAGINVVKNIGGSLLLKTGVQYNRINESFRLTQINERRLVTTISVRTVIISPSDTVRIRDTSTVEQIGTAQHRHQNTYTQWDVPVIIGYEFSSENIRLNANAGIITNIRSAYQGEMIADSTRKIVDINQYNGTPIYRRTVGFSLYAGLSILKPLSEKMSLLVEPHARIGLGNTTNSPAWFNQKNSAVGLSIGLRYKFGGSRQRIY